MPKLSGVQKWPCLTCSFCCLVVLVPNKMLPQEAPQTFDHVARV